MRSTRQETERLLGMCEEGLLDWQTVVIACVKYMSEDDVADMMDANEWSERFNEDEEEDEDTEEDAEEEGED